MRRSTVNRRTVLGASMATPVAILASAGAASATDKRARNSVAAAANRKAPTCLADLAEVGA